MSKPWQWPASMACMTNAVTRVMRIGYVENVCRRIYRRIRREKVCRTGGRPLSRRPGEAAAADEVQVDVEDRLPGVAVGVEHHPEAAGRNAALFGDGGRAPRQLADNRVVLRRQLVERRDVALGDDEHMRRGLRLDVFEGQDAFVLVHDLGWQLAVDDLAEKTVRHYARMATAIRQMPCRS